MAEVSTRNVDNMLQAMGLTRFDKSKVSRACRELTELVTEFRERELGAYPNVWLDVVLPCFKPLLMHVEPSISAGRDSQGTGEAADRCTTRSSG
jgi:hypothetical protein